MLKHAGRWPYILTVCGVLAVALVGLGVAWRLSFSGGDSGSAEAARGQPANGAAVSAVSGAPDSVDPAFSVTCPGGFSATIKLRTLIVSSEGSSLDRTWTQTCAGSAFTAWLLDFTPLTAPGGNAIVSSTPQTVFAPDWPLTDIYSVNMAAGDHVSLTDPGGTRLSFTVPTGLTATVTWQRVP